MHTYLLKIPSSYHGHRGTASQPSVVSLSLVTMYWRPRYICSAVFWKANQAQTCVLYTPWYKVFWGLSLINHDNLVAVKQSILTGIKIIFNVFLNQNFLKIFGMYCYFPLSCKHTLKGEKLCSREYFSASGPPAYR